ncbi:MAG: outer membrane beta-barrel protein [Mariprofundaceae bacterium]
MKKTAAHMATVLMVLMFAASAMAEGVKPYVGLGLGVYTLGIDSPTADTDETLGAYLSAGVDVARFFGAEIRLGTTTNEASVSPLTGEIRAKYIASYLGKLQIPFKNGLRIYVLGGGSTAVVHFGLPINDSMSLSGISFGGGFDYVFSGQLFSSQYRIGVESMRYFHNVNLPSPQFPNNSQMSIDTLVATLKYTF